MHTSLKAQLSRLFDSQLDTLRRNQIPNRLLRKLESYQHRLTSQDVASESVLPFLPVLPLSRLELRHQLLCVNHAQHQAISKLHPLGIYDLAQHEEPYYLCRVDEGKRYLGLNGLIIQEQMLQRSQLALSVAEGLALAVHTNILNRHNALLLGSRYKIGDESIILEVIGPQAQLRRIDLRFSHHNAGAPFCLQRLTTTKAE